jgi:hypothetical protein
MRQLRVLTLLVLACALFSVPALLAQTQASAVRIVNPIDEKHLVTLKGFTHPLANAKNDRGAAPDDMPLERIHLTLKRSASQDVALRQLISEMHQPGTASYHKWLTPEQFGKQFGPSDEDIATVSTWLSSHGFSVTKVNPGKQTLEFTGNAGQFRSAFHAQIHKYQVDDETHYSNSSDPQIPEALAPVVGGFVSLNNFRAKSYVKSLGEANYSPKTDKAKPLWTTGTSGNLTYQDNFILSPGDYAIQYDIKPLYTAGITGAGQTIAIVNDSNINIARVNAFRTLFGLPANPPQVIVDGNDPGVDGINNPDGPNFDSVEAYLDVEWSGAVAQNATIDLVVAADTALENGLILAAEHAVYGNIAPVMSLSFGNCEANLGTSNAFLSNLWEQAAAQGITVMVSTGDSGSAGCDDDNTQYYAVLGQAVSGFASTPFNVAVGGTDFYYSDYNATSASTLDTQLASYWNTTLSNSTPEVSILGVIPEQPWNNSQFGLNIFSVYSPSNLATSISGGSGGASNAALNTNTTPTGYPKPVWQTGSGVPSDGVRDLPDVSLFASSGINDSYYPICATDGDCQPVASGDTVQIFGVGGTSASTPAFAGIMALVNQKYGAQGQADFVLYPLKTQYPAAFHDVTNGTNSVPCAITSPNCITAIPSSLGYVIDDPTFGTATEGMIGTGTTPEYNAAAGYNLATGLGTIDANVLVTDWNKIAFAASATTVTVTPANNVALSAIPHGSSVTFSGTVTGTGTPTGDVGILTSSTDPVNGGQAFFTLASGAYSDTITWLPGGSYTVWAQYGGDSKNGLSNSTPVAITVIPEASSLWLNVLNPVSGGSPTIVPSGTTGIPYGTQITLSAQPSPQTDTNFESCFTGASSGCPNFGIPTGTVTFKDGSTTLNTAIINAEGDAEYYNPTTYNVGSHSITASYSGDASYGASSAAASTFTIVQTTPTVFLTTISDSNSGYSVPQGVATPLTILVEGFGNGAAPTGTITITGAPSGTPATATLSAGVDPNFGVTVGAATIVIPATAGVGNYTIGASYAPDSASATNYTSASAASIGLSITGTSGITTTTTATASPSAPSPNSAVTISGTVTAASGAAPTGTVYLLVGALDPSTGGNSPTYFGPSTTLTAGSGKSSTYSFVFNSGGFLQGANQFTVLYGGSSSDLSSSAYISISNPLSDFTLTPAKTIVPISVSGSATNTVNVSSVNGFSGAVNLTCTAATGITCTILPTSETLTSGSSSTATLTINAGASTLNGNYNVLITGTDSTGEYVHTLTVTAVVSGATASEGSFTLSNSGSINIVAGAATGNTSAISVLSSGGFTGSVALTCAPNNPPSGATLPTCTVTPSVSIEGTVAATATLTIATSSSTTAGTYTFAVTGVSGTITQTTNVTVAIGVPSFTLPAASSLSFTAGATTGNTAAITVTPTNGFTGTVTLSCAVSSPSGATDPATCSIPSSVTISGTAAQTATLTINSTAPTTTTTMNQEKKFFWPTAGGTALALVFLFGIPAKRRKWLALFGLLVMLATGAVVGCGGGGGSGCTSNCTTTSGGTSTGAYVFTVTATSGSITQTTTVTANITN